jgi:hypothetical protein
MEPKGIKKHDAFFFFDNIITKRGYVYKKKKKEKVFFILFIYFSFSLYKKKGTQLYILERLGLATLQAGSI